MVDIVVRNSPLGDVLHVIANAGGLNLLIDGDVDLEQRVTLSIRHALVGDALDLIFSNLDYFYTIDNNLLKVSASETRIFELGQPALVNSFAMDVGGDILSSSGLHGLKGTITSGNKGDTKAYDFWGSLETSIEHIMGTPVARVGSPARSAAAPELQRNRQPSQGAPAPADAGPGSSAAAEVSAPPHAATGGQQNLTVNRLTGTIMVTGSRRTLEKVANYLSNVRKVLNRQVIIEARIIEVQLDDSLQYGIDWSFLAKIGKGSINGGFGTLNVGTTTFSDATAAAASASKFQLGVSTSDFQALLTALQTQGTVKTLSNPKINVMNGHPSLLTVGTSTSFISKVATTTTATAAGNSITFVPETTSVLSGLIIGIIPYISEAGEISLNITPITSELISLQDKTFGTAGNQVTITIPTIALREMTTTVKLWDRQIAVIGGLISKKDSATEQKVPLLGYIPYLGKIFFTRINNTQSKSELVLLLRPSLLENQ
jgi:MSHA type pilus biogenesis protein MshL